MQIGEPINDLIAETAADIVDRGRVEFVDESLNQFRVAKVGPA